MSSLQARTVLVQCEHAQVLPFALGVLSVGRIARRSGAIIMDSGCSVAVCGDVELKQCTREESHTVRYGYPCLNEHCS